MAMAIMQENEYGGLFSVNWQTKVASGSLHRIQKRCHDKNKSLPESVIGVGAEGVLSVCETKERGGVRDLGKRCALTSLAVTGRKSGAA
jgi:hypothetical protein